MQRAMELALLGMGRVSPNPMVGCVIVYRGKVIGEGWHRAYGGPHAEVNAVADVEQQDLLSESTVYVSLEPCSHYGKTPPCADLLIRHRVKKVIVANTDPNPLVSGQGIAKLRAAGITVEVGLLEQEGRELNRRFFTFIERRRPFVLLKWAETSDGFVARENYDSKWISSTFSRKLVHQWRAEEDAIMVGTRTAQYDDPQLNVRDWKGRDPVRVVIDRELRLDRKLKLFDQRQQTLCYTTRENRSDGAVEYIRLDREGFLQALFEDLYHRKIQSLMIEGGATLLSSVMEAGLWDEARIFKSMEVRFEEGIAAPTAHGTLVSTALISGDRLSVYHRHG